MLEVSNHFTRGRFVRALAMRPVARGRELIDSLEFDSPVAQPVRDAPSDLPGIAGRWFVPPTVKAGRTVLYFHGGGYAFHARAHHSFIGHLALAAGSRVFALDYRLTPEHPHPAQLEDALRAYRALLVAGTDSGQLVLAGDSAGGHLVLDLLREVRDRGLPMPALAVGLCPWTEVDPTAAGPHRNDRFDWVPFEATGRLARWLVGDAPAARTSVSPMDFDLRGFPPLYLQAGGREVLVDMIVRFAQHVAAARQTVTLDVWEHMTHDFQAFGNLLPDSREALQRFGSAIDHHLGARRACAWPASARTVLQFHDGAIALPSAGVTARPRVQSRQAPCGERALATRVHLEPRS